MKQTTLSVEAALLDFLSDRGGVYVSILGIKAFLDGKTCLKTSQTEILKAAGNLLGEGKATRAKSGDMFFYGVGVLRSFSIL